MNLKSKNVWYLVIYKIITYMKENVNCVKLNSEIQIYYGNTERQFQTTDQ